MAKLATQSITITISCKSGQCHYDASGTVNNGGTVKFTAHHNSGGANINPLPSILSDTSELNLDAGHSSSPLTVILPSDTTPGDYTYTFGYKCLKTQGCKPANDEGEFTVQE